MLAYTLQEPWTVTENCITQYAKRHAVYAWQKTRWLPGSTGCLKCLWHHRSAQSTGPSHQQDRDQGLYIVDHFVTEWHISGCIHILTFHSPEECGHLSSACSGGQFRGRVYSWSGPVVDICRRHDLHKYTCSTLGEAQLYLYLHTHIPGIKWVICTNLKVKVHVIV